MLDRNTRNTALEFGAFLLFAFILFGGWPIALWVLRVAWALIMAVALVIVGYIAWIYLYMWNKQRRS